MWLLIFQLLILSRFITIIAPNVTLSCDLLNVAVMPKYSIKESDCMYLIFDLIFWVYGEVKVAHCPLWFESESHSHLCQWVIRLHVATVYWIHDTRAKCTWEIFNSSWVMSNNPIVWMVGVVLVNMVKRNLHIIKLLHIYS